MKGHLKYCKPGKSFGFIRAKNGSEYFFHQDDYEGKWDELQEMHRNAEVSNTQIMMVFEPNTESERGPRASNVRLFVEE